MDGTAAIEANRAALIRIVAMLVEMAGLAQPLTSPLMGEVATQSREGVTLRSQPPPDASRRPPHKGEVELRATIPRLLWRAILALLRPAESAARRLIIAAAKGLKVPPPRPCQPKPRPKPIEPLLRRLGIAVTLPPGEQAPVLSRLRGVNDRIAEDRSIVPVARWKASERRDGASAPGIWPAGSAEGGGGGAINPRIPTFPLFDPPRRLNLHGRRRPTVPPHAAPRIFVPGLTEPAPLPPPPSSDDLISATRLTQRLAALAAALDDLPGQARRFARWKARRQTARLPIRRVPPGGRLYRYDPSITHPPNIREIDEILAHAHSLALHALESPDTS